MGEYQRFEEMFLTFTHYFVFWWVSFAFFKY